MLNRCSEYLWTCRGNCERVTAISKRKTVVGSREMIAATKKVNARKTGTTTTISARFATITYPLQRHSEFSNDIVCFEYFFATHSVRTFTILKYETGKARAQWRCATKE